jgi:hypothetical protein
MQSPAEFSKASRRRPPATVWWIGPSGRSVTSSSGGAAVNDPDGWRITRRHVEELLSVMRLSPAQERRYFSVAAAAFESVGVDLDTLVDRMGGSP